MTTKAHSLLTGSDLHEPKGISVATANQVYAADGSGSGTWKKLDATNLSGLANPFGASLLHIRDQRSSGVASPVSTASGLVTRPLNTVVTNEIVSASLSGNQISLPAGTYHAAMTATGRWALDDVTHVDTGVAFLYDTTHNVTLVQSHPQIAFLIAPSDSYICGVNFEAEGRFTLAGTSSIECRHFTNAVGLNVTVLNNLGLAEVFTSVYIWKLSQ